MKRPKATLLAALAMLSVALDACGGLQAEDPGQVLRDAGTAMAKLRTVTATLKFTKGAISFQGYVLTSATAAVRLPGESDTIYKVKYQDVLIGLEVVITGGHVFLRPPFSGFTPVTGKTAAEVPDLAKLFDGTTGLPAMIPAGHNLTYVGSEKVGDIDSRKVGAIYSAAQIAKLLPQLTSTGDVTATIWVGGSDHLIRKALLSGLFGDGGTASTVEIDLSAFNSAVAIASPTP
ncbi:MAG TPA: LppX_LprAFG lipoprotein [Candidatus Dormibacteraeota bacterium]|nr:LppX_LprAFG lipoprotein [Candidatus Dormibacteraeota bacterium]